MSNDYYNHGNVPATRAPGSSATMRAEFDAVQSGFDKMAPLVPLAFFRGNAAGTAQESLAPSAALTALGGAEVTKIQNGEYLFLGAVTGTDTITADLDPDLTAYAAGQQFYGIAAGTNTGATTLNINSLGAKSIKVEGAALVGGEIALGKPFVVLYDGTDFQLVNPYSGLFLRKTGGTLTGAINESRASVTGHATTTPIWDAAGNAVEITGTPTITDFPDAPQAGAMRRIFPAAGTVLTNNANIKVQGGADYTFATGDWALVEALTVDTFQATVVKADGRAVVEPTQAPTVRQTVLHGPVDTNGFSAFGGATGSATVTAAGTLKLTSSNGDIDRVWSVTNPSWTGLSTNGTMYLYLDETDGAVASTLAPNYRFGGADVTTNGQLTYNIQEAVAKVGNGSAAAQKYRVCVGEVTVAGGVVTAITWYQLKGRYDSGWFAVGLTTTYSKNHNLGFVPTDLRVLLSEASNGAAPRPPVTRTAGSGVGCSIIANTATNCQVITSTLGVGLSTADTVAASGYYKIIGERDW